MDELKWYENLKLLRERMGLSQKDLSAKLGISNRTLQRYESGESEPTLSILINLSKIFDTSIDNIVGNRTSSSIDLSRIESHIKTIEASCNTLRHDISLFDDILL